MNIFRHAHLPNHYEMQYTVFEIVIFSRNPLSCFYNSNSDGVDIKKYSFIDCL